MAQGNSQAFCFDRIALEVPNRNTPHEFQNFDAEFFSSLPADSEVELCLDIPGGTGDVSRDLIEQGVVGLLQDLVGPLAGNTPVIVVNGQGYKLAKIDEQPMDNSDEDTQSEDDDEEDDDEDSESDNDDEEDDDEDTESEDDDEEDDDEEEDDAWAQIIEE